MQGSTKRVMKYRGIDIVLIPSPRMFVEEQSLEEEWRWYMRIPIGNGDTICLAPSAWVDMSPVLVEVGRKTTTFRRYADAFWQAQGVIDHLIAHSPDRVRSSQIPSRSDSTDE